MGKLAAFTQTLNSIKGTVSPLEGKRVEKESVKQVKEKGMWRRKGRGRRKMAPYNSIQPRTPKNLNPAPLQCLLRTA